MTINLKNELNKDQYKAVTIINKPVLVIAGAGSGKTRVIEYRVLHLIQSGVNPESILLLTFTKKAAFEMLKRVSKHDPRCERIDGGTFHSFAFKQLKHFAKSIGFTNSFSILDESDSNELIGKCITKLGLLDAQRRFPKKETVKSILSKTINKQVSIKSILEREYPQFEEWAQELKTLQNAYIKLKIEANYADYDDLLVYTKLLLEKPEIRERLQEKYTHIMVDEYQDTNKLQGDITYYLAENTGNIMAVGDDAQSIYGFRGATHENIMEFPIRFPNCEIIKLEQNYRSTQSILDVSNAVLHTMKNKYEKKLSAASKETGVRPEILSFKNTYEEAQQIVQLIKCYRDEGISLGKQAVLFRSAYISIPLQTELSKANIPFQVYGGMKFYETAHVKDMVAYLKILQNFKDEIAWSRILKLIEGIGPKTADMVFNKIRASQSLSLGIEALAQNFGKGFSYSSEINKLTEMFIDVEKEGMSIYQQFERILSYYKPILKKRYDEWHLRLSDLETLLEITAGYSSLDELLADFALEMPERGVSDNQTELKDERPLTLSTIHSAKGLEWDTVYVMGLVDGVLPSRFSLKFEDQIEEEHRLFYVAVTRAKRQLYLTMSHEGMQGGLFQFNRMSRFLENRIILEKLGQRLITAREKTKPDSKIHLVSDDFIDEIYDKKTLFKKINDSWKW